MDAVQLELQIIHLILERRHPFEKKRGLRPFLLVGFFIIFYLVFVLCIHSLTLQSA